MNQESPALAVGSCQYNIDDGRKGNRRHIIVHEGEGVGYTTKHEPINPENEEVIGNIHY